MFSTTSRVLTLMCLLGSLLSSGMAQTFTSQKYDTGPFPAAVAIADFNGDGVPDLAVTDFQNNQLSILFGNGDGTFTPGDVYTTGTQPVQLVAADFNGDGIQDLAVLTSGDNGVTVWYGNGDGTFAAGGLFVLDGTPVAIAAPDLNRDGFPDWVIVVNHSNAPSTLELYPNDGTGNFTLIQVETLPGQPAFRAVLVTADFNQDGIPDLAVGVENQVLILTGNGDGTVLPQNTISPPQTASVVGLAAGSFTGSGVPDLVVRVFDSPGTTNTNSEYIYLNAGDGTMNLVSKLPAHSSGGYVITADVNGDGLADVVSIDTSAHNGGANYALSNGDGTFGAPVDIGFPTFSSPAGGLAADLNGDSRIDLVITGRGILGNGLQGTYVFLNNGN